MTNFLTRKRKIEIKCLENCINLIENVKVDFEVQAVKTHEWNSCSFWFWNAEYILFSRIFFELKHPTFKSYRILISSISNILSKAISGYLYFFGSSIWNRIKRHDSILHNEEKDRQENIITD